MRFYYFLLIFLLFFSAKSQGQCPRLYDGAGNPSNNPLWVSCSGGNFNLFIQSPDNIGDYTLDFGDGSPIVSGSGLVPPNFISHNYTATIDTFVVTLTENISGCVISGLVVMEEPVNASIQIPVGGLTAACAPAALDFINSSTNVSATTTFTWDFGDGSPIQTFDWTNGGQAISHTYQPGTVNCQTQVTLTAQNYCSGGFPTIASFNPIQIWDVDDAQITASETLLCYPDTIVTFTNNTNKNCVPQGNTFQRYEYWNFGDYWGLGYDSIVPWQPYDPPARPGYTIGFPGIGSYTVMMIDSNYCGQDTAFITVNIVPPPTAIIASNKDTVCVGDPVSFSNLSTGGANSYSWNFGDGGGWVTSGAGTQNHTFNNAGDYTIFLVANITGGTNSCTDTTSINVHVLPRPQAAFTMDDAIGCDNLTVNFTNTSVSAISWAWNFGNGNTSTLQNPPSQFYSTAGTYNPSLTVTSLNGCDHTFTGTVRVFITPIASFFPTNVCEDELATFTDNSTSSAGDPVISWSWNFGDGGSSTIENPFHTYANIGTYNVVLAISTANCANSDTIPVTVEQKPTAGFTSNLNSGCSPLNVSFTNSSANADTYSWNFGDGSTSTLSNPTHIFTNNTSSNITYTVTLISRTTFGCADTLTRTITVFAIPQAGFTSNAVPSCAPMPVSFINTTTGASTYQWNFGDGNGSTLTNPNHLYQNQTLFIQNYTVSLIAQSVNGCTDTTSQTIITYPEPQFGFTTNPDSGCSPLTVTFPSVIGAVVYQWDFGDGATGTGPTPVHTYINSTTNNISYQVRLIATNPFGCTDTTYNNVIVNPNPNAIFIVSTTAGCQPLNVNFQNNSTGAVNFNWNFDDGTTSTASTSVVQHSFTHTSQTPITYDVELIVETSAGCTDTAVHQVTVYPKVTAAFANDSIGCSPLPVKFINQSLNASTFDWNLGDGFSDVTSDPLHTYLNNTTADVIRTVTLISTSSFGCADTITKQIIIHHKPVSSFTVDKTTSCQPAAIRFQNTSLGAVNFFWDMDDGFSSSTMPGLFDHSYVHTSATPVVYNPFLIVETTFGCKDTSERAITINPQVLAAFTSPIEGCSPYNVSFTNQSQGANSYVWNFGDGANDILVNPSHNFINNSSGDTTFTTQLISTSIYNCYDTTSTDILIHPSPTAGLTATPVSQVYPDATVNLTNSTSTGVWQYLWNFGDGLTSNLPNPSTHLYSTWGNYTISLIASSIYCSDTTIQNIEIIPPIPIADFVGSKSGCRPVTVEFVNRSVYGTNYLWNFGDGGVSTQLNPVYTYYVPGTYTITLTVMGPGGQTTTIHQDSVTVSENPEAFFVSKPSVVSIPNEPVINYNISTNATKYLWDFGDGTKSDEVSPEHNYTEEGEYTITLIAYNDAGCTDTFIVANAVRAEENGDLIVPNAFTPNPNGPSGGAINPFSFDNDVFHPLTSGVIEYKLSIFNRWGELIFESSDIKIGWDGYYREELCKQDVYIWKIQARFSEGRSVTKTGDVLLLR